ncbi:MAG: hypothetical protein O3C60_16945 [Planctomycetota bacterium]|nr:hypothetical protein [Planctomycetota bacterium]
MGFLAMIWAPWLRMALLRMAALRMACVAKIRGWESQQQVRSSRRRIGTASILRTSVASHDSIRPKKKQEDVTSRGFDFPEGKFSNSQ